MTVSRYSVAQSPPMETNWGALSCRDGLLLQVANDEGYGGSGEAAPLPRVSLEGLGEVAGTAVRLSCSLRGSVVPPYLSLLTDRFERWIGAHGLVPSLRFGLETAVLTMLAARHQTTLSEFLANDPVARVPVAGTLRGPRRQMVRQARARREAGFTTVRMDVGTAPPEDDARTVRAVRRALGPDVELRLDAHRAWDYDAGLAFARGVKDCGIEYVEEPLDNPGRFVDFAGRSGLPVALDETAEQCGYEDLEQWRGAKAAVLRPTLLGGFEVTMWLARRAANLGMTPIIGAAQESAVGLDAVASLAACLMEGKTAAEIPVHGWFNAAGPVEAPVEGGAIDLARAHGLVTPQRLLPE